MAVLENLEPKKVFHFFEQICGIPHGSSDTWMISDYLVDFAKERGLSVRQDELGNVIIKKGGTPGYEQSPVVMIQGHMDMVCEKNQDVAINFHTDGLKLKVQDGVVSACGTTLGGDDGIAVAFALAILDSDDIKHPPLEVVMTVDEEIGMLGAAALDTSDLKATYMLNLDSEDEGQLLVGCAGGLTGECHMPVTYEKLSNLSVEWKDAEQYRICITGLLGGHSGMEITKQRANANKLLGRVLKELGNTLDLRLIDLDGGKKDNAIAREAQAEFLIQSQNTGNLKDALEKIRRVIRHEYLSTDPGLEITLETCAMRGVECMTQESTDSVVNLLFLSPNGVQRMSTEMEGLVQTSLNLGVLTLDREKNEVFAGFSVRSSLGSEKDVLSMQLKVLTEQLGGYYTEKGAYTAWEYKKDSRLRELMVKIYEKMYGHKPLLDVIHAGVECGIFTDKIQNLDCVSYGPKMQDIHTPKECLYVDSVKRTWEYTLKILENLQ